MNNIIKFGINSMDFVDNAQNDLFRKVRIKAFASGENAHTLPIDEDVLKRGALTVYNKPILWKYNPFTDDANTHDEDEVPCGFVPETDNNVVFERENDGRLFMIINALLWTKYCGRLVDIFKRDGYKKDVSIEIITRDDETSFGEKPKVLDFVIAGITILGEWIDPACKGSQAQLLKFSIDDFSADKDKYIKEYKISSNNIEIKNTKEYAVNSTWSNPRRKLFNPIINSNNKKELLKEAYLTCDHDNPMISKCKYPHHIIKDNKLVLDINGLKTAFNKMAQQDIINEDMKSHLLRHYKELGLNTENIKQFNFSVEEYKIFKDKIFSEDVGENKMKDKEKDMQTKEMATENANNESEKDMGCGSEDMGCDSEKGMATNEEEKEQKDNKEEMTKKMAEMEKEMARLKEDNSAYMAKIEAMSDYEELKKFKTDTEEKMAREKEMAEMEKVMSEIESRGIKMSDEDKKSFMNDIKKFSSISAWSNYVKATAFDKVEKFDGIYKYANTDYNEKSGNSIWDRI